MAPRPVSGRIPEPFENRSVADDVPAQQMPPGRGDTPSPRTPTTTGSLSPSPFLTEPAAALVPLDSDNGIPYDHTLPHYIRQVAGEPSLEEVQNMSLRVLTDTASLQQMTIYTPNLRELNLEGSGLTSLRDIGSELRFLHILRIGRCRLRSLDGTLGLASLRELHASGNRVTNAAPCAHLSHLRLLDLSRLAANLQNKNELADTASLGFLGSCRRLENVRLVGNPVASNTQLHSILQSIVRTLRTLDGVALPPLQPVEADDLDNMEEPLAYEMEDLSLSSVSSDTTST